MKAGIKKSERRTDKPDRKFRDYIIQLSIVVLGILITFTMSDVIGKYNQNREVNKAMQLVKEELTLNKMTLQSLDTMLRADKGAARFILRHQSSLADAPSDSLDMYGSRLFFWYTITFGYDAMEMLKASGVFQKIDDSDIAFLVIKSYREVKQSEDIYKVYADMKMGLRRKLDENPILNKKLLESKQNDFVGLWNILLAHTEGRALITQIPHIIGSDNPFEHSIRSIDEVLNMINERYN